MNSDKHSPDRQSGNAMIYILLALALIGILTMVMARQNDQGGDNIDTEQAEIQASQILSYAASARLAIENMLIAGTKPADISFVRPDESGYGTGMTINQFYHPDGGGFNHKSPQTPPFIPAASVAPEVPPGWYISTRSNVAWTPTATKDIIISALNIEKSICEQINKKLTGSKAIPVLGTGTSTRILFANYAAIDALDTTSCAGCEGYTQLCVLSEAAQDYGTYYSVILAQ